MKTSMKNTVLTSQRISASVSAILQRSGKFYRVMGKYWKVCLIFQAILLLRFVCMILFSVVVMGSLTHSTLCQARDRISNGGRARTI